MNRTDDPEPSLDDGVRHLQTAAHEMVAAARSFLDVVEEVVSDRERLAALADRVSGVLADAGTSLGRLAGHGSAPAEHADPPARPARVRRIDVDDATG